MLNFNQSLVSAFPYPHALADGVLADDLFAGLLEDFPDDDIFLGTGKTATSGGRASRINLCRYHDEFPLLIDRSDAWRTLYEYCNSAAYIEFVIDLFQNQIGASGTTVDTGQWSFDTYAEHPPLNLTEKILARSGVRKMIDRTWGLFQRNRLCVSFDIAFGGSGYGTEIHTDNRNKLSAMLIYFNEPGGEGGEFCVYERTGEKPLALCERYPDEKDVRAAKKIEPQPNRGVILLNSNNSYHGAMPITGNPVARRFLYVSINERFTDNAWRTAA